MPPLSRSHALALVAFVAGLAVALVGMLTLAGGGHRLLSVVLILAGFAVILSGSWYANRGSVPARRTDEAPPP